MVTLFHEHYVCQNSLIFLQPTFTTGRTTINGEKGSCAQWLCICIDRYPSSSLNVTYEIPMTEWALTSVWVLYVGLLKFGGAFLYWVYGCQHFGIGLLSGVRINQLQMEFQPFACVRHCSPSEKSYAQQTHTPTKPRNVAQCRQISRGISGTITTSNLQCQELNIARKTVCLVATLYLYSQGSLSSQAVLQMGVSRPTRSRAKNSLGTQATAARDYTMREKSNLSIFTPRSLSSSYHLVYTSSWYTLQCDRLSTDVRITVPSCTIQLLLFLRQYIFIPDSDTIFLA